MNVHGYQKMLRNANRFLGTYACYFPLSIGTRTLVITLSSAQADSYLLLEGWGETSTVLTPGR